MTENADKRNYTTYILLGAMVLVGAVGGYVAFEYHRKSQITQGEALFQQGDYASVADYFSPLLEGRVGRPEEHMLLAESLYRLRRYDESETALQPLLEFGREDVRAVTLSGWISLKKGSELIARDRFEKADSMGASGEAQAGIAAIHLRRSQGSIRRELEDARFHITDALKSVPNNPRALLTAAELYIHDHNQASAIETAQKAIREAPHWSETHLMLGRAHLLAGRFPEAEAALEQSLALGGSPIEARYHLAISVYRQGRLSQARDLLTELANQESDIRRRALEDAARIDLALGEYESAVERLRDSYSIQKSPSTGMLLYQTLTRMDREMEASNLLEEILAERRFVSDARLERANIYYRLGQTEQAFREYQAVRDQDPENGYALFNMGCLALAGRLPDRAPDYFRAALEAMPGYLPAQVNLALAYAANRQTVEAQQILEEAREAHPEDDSVLAAIAVERFLSGETETALALLRVDREERPAIIPLIRGEIYLRLYLFRQAREAFLDALRIDSTLTRAKIGAAHCALRLGWYEDAALAYQELLDRQPPLTGNHEAETRNAMALLRLEQNAAREASDLWQLLADQGGLGARLAQLNLTLSRADRPTAEDFNRLRDAASPNDALPEAHYNLALLLERSGDWDEAVETYQALLIKHPRYLPALVRLANLFHERRRYDEASALMRRARRIAPDRVDIQNNFAAILFSAGELQQAVAQLSEAAEQDAEQMRLISNLALTALRQGDLTEAESHLETLRASGSLPDRRWLIEGLILAENLEWAQAEAAFAQARNYRSDDPFILLNHGAALAKLDRLNEAEQAITEAVSINPNLAAGYRALGLLAAQRGLFRDAQRFLRQSLSLDSAQQDLPDILAQLERWMSQAAG